MKTATEPNKYQPKGSALRAAGASRTGHDGASPQRCPTSAAESTLKRWGATKAWLARFVAGQIVPVKEPAAKKRVYAAAISLEMRVATHPQGLVVVWDGQRRYDGSTPALPPPKESPMAECPVCRAEFLPLKESQVTCGKPRCTRVVCEERAMMCECGRGRKLNRGRGCAECEADTSRFYDSEAAHKRRLAAASRAEIQERLGLSQFAEEWNKEHREYSLPFNSCGGLSEKAA